MQKKNIQNSVCLTYHSWGKKMTRWGKLIKEKIPHCLSFSFFFPGTIFFLEQCVTYHSWGMGKLNKGENGFPPSYFFPKPYSNKKIILSLFLFFFFFSLFPFFFISPFPFCLSFHFFPRHHFFFQNSV